MGFSSKSETFREGEQLVEGTGTRDKERDRAKYNVVGHTVGVGIED
jgi:hypothetical protein